MSHFIASVLVLLVGIGAPDVQLMTVGYLDPWTIFYNFLHAWYIL